MDAHQYVHAVVTSGHFCYRRFYYTYHSDVDAHQYVHVDVPSGHLFPECFITQLTAIRTLPSMYTLMCLQNFQYLE